MKAQRVSRGIALPNLRPRHWRWGGGVSTTSRPLYPPGKDPVPIVQEAGWATGPVWTGAENLAPTGIRSPDRPACSESLYRLRYPSPTIIYIQTNNWCIPIVTHRAKIQSSFMEKVNSITQKSSAGFSPLRAMHKFTKGKLLWPEHLTNDDR